MSLTAVVFVAISAAVHAVVVSEATVSIELVILDTPSPADELAVLPTPQANFAIGQTFCVEMWSRTTDSNGLSQVSADVLFDAELASAIDITHTSLFDLFPSGIIDNVSGVVDDLSGSHFPGQPSCGDQVGVPTWARVAVIGMLAVSPGVLTVQSATSGSTVYTVVLCGSLDEPTVKYGLAEVRTGPEVPTVSEWGMIAMTLLVLSAGTVVLARRRTVQTWGT